MKKLNAYVSVPIEVDLDTYVAPLRDKFGNVNFRLWKRGSIYSDSLLRAADVVIAVLPNNGFSSSWDRLTRGLKSEIELAGDLQKPLLVSYRNMSGSVNLYNCEVTEDGIKAVSGYLTGVDLAVLKESINTLPFDTSKFGVADCSDTVIAKESAAGIMYRDRRLLLM